MRGKVFQLLRGLGDYFGRAAQSLSGRSNDAEEIAWLRLPQSLAVPGSDAEIGDGVNGHRLQRPTLPK